MHLLYNIIVLMVDLFRSITALSVLDQYVRGFVFLTMKSIGLNLISVWLELNEKIKTKVTCSGLSFDQDKAISY